MKYTRSNADEGKRAKIKRTDSGEAEDCAISKKETFPLTKYRGLYSLFDKIFRYSSFVTFTKM